MADDKNITELRDRLLAKAVDADRDGTVSSAEQGAVAILTYTDDIEVPEDMERFYRSRATPENVLETAGRVREIVQKYEPGTKIEEFTAEDAEEISQAINISNYMRLTPNLFLRTISLAQVLDEDGDDALSADEQTKGAEAWLQTEKGPFTKADAVRAFTDLREALNRYIPGITDEMSADEINQRAEKLARDMNRTPRPEQDTPSRGPTV